MSPELGFYRIPPPVRSRASRVHSRQSQGAGRPPDRSFACAEPERPVFPAAPSRDVEQTTAAREARPGVAAEARAAPRRAPTPGGMGQGFRSDLGASGRKRQPEDLRASVPHLETEKVRGSASGRKRQAEDLRADTRRPKRTATGYQTSSPPVATVGSMTGGAGCTRGL